MQTEKNCCCQLSKLSQFSRSVVYLLLKSQNLFFQSTTYRKVGILSNTTHGTQIEKKLLKQMIYYYK